MAVVVRNVPFDEQHVYPVVFNSNALFKLEKETGLSTERIGLMLSVGRAGYQIMQIVVWAGLEAARVRDKTRRDPFTIDEVGELIDRAGGPGLVWAPEDDGLRTDPEDGQKKAMFEPRPMHPVAAEVLAAWKSAFDIPQRPLEAGQKKSDPNEIPAS